MKKIKVGLIGVGRIGKLHLENISMRIPSAEAIAIADVYIEEAKKIGERFD
ncbi:MAG: Gfo/Idh/MocA family oxidoreductase, partial [Candidatus Hodarchaeales archaeon]